MFLRANVGNSHLFVPSPHAFLLQAQELACIWIVWSYDEKVGGTAFRVRRHFEKPNVFISPDLYRSLHQSLALYQRSQTCCMVSNHVSRAVWYPHVSSSGVLDSATLYPHALALPLFWLTQLMVSARFKQKVTNFTYTVSQIYVQNPPPRCLQNYYVPVWI